MNASTFIEPIKRHPFILLGGVAAVLIIVQLRSGKKSEAAPTTGVFGITADPGMLALEAERDKNAAQVSIASLQTSAMQAFYAMQGDVAKAEISAKLTGELATAGVASETVAVERAKVGLAEILGLSKINSDERITYATQALDKYKVEIGQQLGTAQLAANIFGTAVDGLTTLDWGPGYAGEPGTSDITTNTPGALMENAGQGMIAELFNNVIRAGQGDSPWQTKFLSNFNRKAVETPAFLPAYLYPEPRGGDSRGGGGDSDP